MKSILRNIKRMSLCLLTLMLWFAITLPVQAAGNNNLKEALVDVLDRQTPGNTLETLNARLAHETLRNILGDSPIEVSYLHWTPSTNTLQLKVNTAYELSQLAELNSHVGTQLITIENQGRLTGEPDDDCSAFILKNTGYTNGGCWAYFNNQGTLKNASSSAAFVQTVNTAYGTLENVTLANAHELINEGLVISGNYMGPVTNQEQGTIIGGTFASTNGNVINQNGGIINGGTFTSTVTNQDGGIINGGSFNSVSNYGAYSDPLTGTHGVINGGHFQDIQNYGGNITSFDNTTPPSLSFGFGSLSPAVAEIFSSNGVTTISASNIMSNDQVTSLVAAVNTRVDAVNARVEEYISRFGSTDGSSPTDTNHTASFDLSALGRVSGSSALAKGASKEERPVPVHIHNYAWVVVTEPTEAENGVEEYRCTGCGEVQERIFTSAAKVYSMKVFDLIKNAEPGSTVPFETKFWTCFTKKMIDQIHEKDLTLEVTFDYQHHTYTFTMKPEDDISSVEKDGYYGFLALKDLLGGHEITTKTEVTEKTEETGKTETTETTD